MTDGKSVLQIVVIAGKDRDHFTLLQKGPSLSDGVVAALFAAADMSVAERPIFLAES